MATCMWVRPGIGVAACFSAKSSSLPGKGEPRAMEGKEEPA